MLPAATLSPTAQPGAAAVAAVGRLADRAEAVDGAAPLNEAALLHLRHPRADVHHLLAYLDERLVGYAQLEHGPEASTAQLVVDPAHRRRGVGTQLAEQLLGEAPTAVRAWSAGASTAAAALAARVGLQVGRELSIMRRDLETDWPAPVVPADVRIRSFQVGQDEPDWLAVNARAFAHHPEQGAITATDLAQRMAEPWFDPAGLLLAVDPADDRLLGFHWTKRQSESLGEIYVLGVDPGGHRRGLGAVLSVAGLRHLRGQGLADAMLYVDESNAAAVKLYERLGFSVWSTDVSYQHRS